MHTAVLFLEGESPPKIESEIAGGTTYFARGEEVQDGAALCKFLQQITQTQPQGLSLLLGMKLHGRFGWMLLDESMATIPRVNHDILVFRKRIPVAERSGQQRQSQSVEQLIIDLQENLEGHFKAVTKGMHLALRSISQKLMRTPSAARTEETVRQDSFKQCLVELYFGSRSAKDVLRCPVTNLVLPSFAVTAGHIFPCRAQEYLSDLCSDLSDINSPQNGILWADVIEAAFESSRICFRWEDERHVLVPTVIDEKLLGLTMYEAWNYMRAEQVQASGEEQSEAELEQQEWSEEELEQQEWSEAELEKELCKMNAEIEQTSSNKEANHKKRWEEQEKRFRGYINQQYKKTSFGDLHQKEIQFPENIHMSTRAFQLTAVLAIDVAKKKGFYPDGLQIDPMDEKNYDPIDAYFVSQETCSSEDECSDSHSSCQGDLPLIICADHTGGTRHGNGGAAAKAWWDCIGLCKERTYGCCLS